MESAVAGSKGKSCSLEDDFSTIFLETFVLGDLLPAESLFSFGYAGGGEGVHGARPMGVATPQAIE